MDEGKQYKNSEVTFIPRTLNKNAVEREAGQCSSSPSPNLGILQTWEQHFYRDKINFSWSKVNFGTE